MCLIIKLAKWAMHQRSIMFGNWFVTISLTLTQFAALSVTNAETFSGLIF
jgi:hypothetical protein